MFTTIQGTNHTSPKYTFTVGMSLKAQPPQIYIYNWGVSKSSTTTKVIIVSAKYRDYDSTDLQDTTSLPI